MLKDRQCLNENSPPSGRGWGRGSKPIDVISPHPGPPPVGEGIIDFSFKH